MPDGPDPPRTAFVLGGGGRWGAVQVGMLDALVEHGIRPDVVIGTSIGAINGAVFASSPDREGVERLRGVWDRVTRDDPLSAPAWERLRSIVQLRVAVQDPEPLREIVASALSVDRIEQLAVPFHCVAASIEQAREHWFDRGPLLDALMASSAVPALFPPVEIDGEHFYDGGLVDSVPVDRAVAAGATEIYVLQVGRLEQALRPPRHFHETALIAFEIARRHRFGGAADRLPEGTELHVLPSANEVDFDDRRQLRWNDVGETHELIARAREATVAHLAGIRPS